MCLLFSFLCSGSTTQYLQAGQQFSIKYVNYARFSRILIRLFESPCKTENKKVSPFVDYIVSFDTLKNMKSTASSSIDTYEGFELKPEASGEMFVCGCPYGRPLHSVSEQPCMNAKHFSLVMGKVSIVG